MSELLANPVLEYGDRRAAETGLILRSTVGSGVHGIAIAGTDDHDEMAVFVEPEEWALGIERVSEHYIARSQPEGARSGPGDTDLVAYTLRKYLRLAVKGNPTALLPLFAPERDVLTITPLGAELRALAPAFLSREASRRFLGFMRSQRRKLVASVSADGFNAKQASHALRLALQGREITRSAHLTLPMPEAERERVLRVKRGDVRDLGVILAEIDVVAAEVEEALPTSPLPEQADLAVINAWSVSAHRRHWSRA